MDDPIELDPKVKISDLDMSLLPLCNFHIVVVVEPGPETWMMPEDDSDNLSQVLKLYSDLIVDDVVGDYEPGTIIVPLAADVEHTLIIMACEYLEVVYFEDTVPYSRFLVTDSGYDFEKLCWLLDGIAKNNPAWNRIAMVGGMYGDEIIRAANAVQALGFDTTIVKRYCISEEAFVNLDDLFDLLSEERKKFSGSTQGDMEDN